MPGLVDIDSDDESYALHRLHAYTQGEWDTEVESAAAFDATIDPDLWRIHREVRGRLIHPRPQQVDKTLRIDRVLVPAPRLIDAGWANGIIGCEIKKSGVKIGPVIAQAMDYSRAVWTLEPGSFRVWLDWTFIWPMAKQSGPIASVLSQNRLGSATSDAWTRIQFKSGENNIVTVGRDGQIRLGAATNGAKVGSR